MNQLNASLLYLRECDFTKYNIFLDQRLYDLGKTFQSTLKPLEPN